MSLRFIGQKKGMAQVFDEEGKLVVCTVILAEPNTVVQIKKSDTDGYNAIQLGSGKLSEAGKRRLAKPQRGHFAKKNVEPCRFLQESRVEKTDDYQVGQEIDATIFNQIKYVDIEGVSKGKGYQGVMKLHGFSGGPGAHGSGFHRHAGSTGMRSTPGRCFPGGKRASRMGGDRMTVQNLRVVAVKGNVLLVAGAVPGGKNALVTITQSLKRR
jgi:large subunit ribosomal protein L3